MHGKVESMPRRASSQHSSKWNELNRKTEMKWKRKMRANEGEGALARPPPTSSWSVRCDIYLCLMHSLTQTLTHPPQDNDDFDVNPKFVPLSACFALSPKHWSKQRASILAHSPPDEHTSHRIHLWIPFKSSHTHTQHTRAHSHNIYSNKYENIFIFLHLVTSRRCRCRICRFSFSSPRISAVSHAKHCICSWQS